jgi:branched-chain amino acid transport system permease protein
MMTLGFYNAIFVVSFGLISRTGNLSLGHAAFAGIGAYVSALLALRLGVPPVIGIPLGGVVAGLVAWGLGSAILRLRGVYFVLVTFLFGQIFTLVVIDARDITGGANGLVGMPSLEIAGFAFTSVQSYYYVMLVAAAAVVVFVSALLRSQYGRALSSVEENTLLAEAVGISSRRAQTVAFALGSGIAGLGGGLVAFYLRYVSPDSFTFWESASAIIMLVVGGRSVMAGWLVGVAFLTPLPEFLREARELQHVIYAVILIAILLFLPGGLISIRDRLFGSKRKGASPALSGEGR